MILSVQDLAAAQEAVRLDRQDREDERRSRGAADAGDGPSRDGTLPGAAHQVQERRLLLRRLLAPPGSPQAARPDPGAPAPGDHPPAARARAAPGRLARRGRLAPAVLGHGPAHHGATVGAASLARPGPVAGTYRAGPGRGAVRRGRYHHRADPQPGRVRPRGPGWEQRGQGWRRRDPGWPRRDAHPGGHPGGRRGPHGCGGLDRRPGVHGRDRVVRPADVRGAGGPWRPGGTVAPARREQSRPAGQRPDRVHRGRAQRVRRPAGQRVRAGRAGQFRDGQRADRGPGGRVRRGRRLPARPADRRGGAGLPRAASCCRTRGCIPPPRRAARWPPARSIRGC